ncbi:MAG TPA: hypothetical protein PKI86_01740 [Chitinophagales bacterium]|nr:hypothetical protein [Chitinophagales bacterium]
MINKIAIVISLLFAIILLYLANVYNNSYEIKLIATERINYIQLAAENFSKFGFVCCFISWVLSNIIAIKTKKIIWLLIPLLLTSIISIIITGQTEEIFKFKKAEGLWEGGFSLSYLVAFFLVIVSVLVIGINYFILKQFLNKTTKV